MKTIRELRHFAAQRHASIGQEYDPGVPYWVHYFVCELPAIAYNLGPTVRRVIWGHDLPEDVKVKHPELREAGWTSDEVGYIYRCTDEEGLTREERKKITLPMTARGGHFPIATKVCDRFGNRLYGQLSGSVSMARKYQGEHPMFKHYLFDKSDTQLLPLWYALDDLMFRPVPRIKKSDFEQRPLRQLINSWIARKETLLNSDKVDLLPEWHKLKALLDAQN